MPQPFRIFVVIPAFDEEHSIGMVLRDLPRDFVEEVIVVDNNSRDATSEKARENGATVLGEKEKGYGAACLKGLEYVRNKQPIADKTIVVFLDGDYSDHPDQLYRVIRPIVEGKADLVIGSRRLGNAEKGSLTPQQHFGNRLATFMIRRIYHFRYTDLGPFRAITWAGLEKIKMTDRNYGWTVEMQIKALKCGLRVSEVPVDYKVRIGKSKVSGTVKGTLLAGYKIITTILRYSRSK
jgi:glycosyltransferase involved in cell wall biosynthesis